MRALAHVRHGSDSGAERPEAQVVWWTGTALPRHAVTGDFWNDLKGKVVS